MPFEGKIRVLECPEKGKYVQGKGRVPDDGGRKMGKFTGARQDLCRAPPEEAGIGIEDPVCPTRCCRGESRIDLAGVYEACIAAGGDMGGAFVVCCLYALLDDAYGEGIVGVPGKGMLDEGGMEEFKVVEVCRTLKSYKIGLARSFLHVSACTGPYCCFSTPV